MNGIVSNEDLRRHLFKHIEYMDRLYSISLPKINYKIGMRATYKADFIWLDKKVIVEVDGYLKKGKVQHSNAWKSKVEQDCFSCIMGYRTLRVTGKDVMNGNAIDWIMSCVIDPDHVVTNKLQRKLH